ncbi:MAG TPA: ABC transporter ATP-binding protein [Candidatus Angelobacter sp.]
MSSAIRTESLTKRFRRLTALSGLDLDVPENTIYALVGPNGAGKTTAIKVLMNILRPTGGRAQVLGMDSQEIAGKTLAVIGYVSENQELPGWMRVGAFLDYLRPFYPAWDRDLENELVKQFDLPLDRKLRHLSRGMRIKAALAGSLAYHPRLIVLDEPFGGLDPLVRDELIEGMLERAAEATVLISSHDLAEIESFASHVGYLDQGRLKFSEEMTALAGRFREVELTLATPGALPEKLPANWMQASAAAATVQFVESRFDQERTSAEIRQVFGEPSNIAFNPMSLRSIFLAMARTGRGPERGGQE